MMDGKRGIQKTQTLLPTVYGIVPDLKCQENSKPLAFMGFAHTATMRLELGEDWDWVSCFIRMAKA